MYPPPVRLCGAWQAVTITASQPTALGLARACTRPFHSCKRLRDTQQESADSEETKCIPYSDLVVGVPTEVLPGERRVAITPQNVALLLKKGFKKVLIEFGAGFGAQFPAHAYEEAGATMVNSRRIWTDSDIVLKVRPPRLSSSNPTSATNDAPRFTSSTNNFVDGFRPGSTIISMLYPNQDWSKPLVQKMMSKGLNSFAMDMIPRISRAQTFDVLSSMANIAGYKAVLEASNHFGRFLTGQTTAAGKIPPCKVLVIGAGVAGLSAIATVCSASDEYKTLVTDRSCHLGPSPWCDRARLRHSLCCTGASAVIRCRIHRGQRQGRRLWRWRLR